MMTILPDEWKPWRVTSFHGVHSVVPEDDLRGHDEGTECWCHPRVEREGWHVMIIHNAMDQRETTYELGHVH